MSKVTFRAKALEHNRKMAIYVGDEIPEMTDFAIVNRTVPELPSGMEKEEETQHHLQKALSAQQACGSISNLIIPIPELKGADHYERIYSTKAGFSVSKKFIHVQPSTTDQELPDYDMDTEDESWLDSHKSIYGDLDSDPVRFENMVDKLEKGSGHLVVKLNEAKALIKEKEDIVIAVYDYWLGKRLRQEKRVKEVLAAKAESLPTLPTPQSSAVNPYLAFRKRAEKMQTRKNRKNDEQSYLGILQLRKSFEKAKRLLEMLKLREGYKKGLMETKRNIFEKRHELKDWTGELVKDSERNIGPVHLPDMSHLFAQSTLDDDHPVQKNSSNRFATTGSGGDLERPRKRRKYRKLAKSQLRQDWQDGSGAASDDVGEDDYEDGDVECKIRNSHSTGNGEREELDRLSSMLSFFKPSTKTIAPCLSYEDDMFGDENSGNVLSDNSEDDALPDGRYTFKRKEGCYYQAPIPYESLASSHNLPMSANQVFAPDMLQVGRGFSVATLPNLPTSGYVRQRVGRGGRVIIDRISVSAQKCDDPDVHSPCSTFHMRHRKIARRGRHGSNDSSGHCRGPNNSSLLTHSKPNDPVKGSDHREHKSDIVTCNSPLKHPQHPCDPSEQIDICNHNHEVEVFPSSSVKSLVCSSSSPVISLPLLPYVKTTIRNSRASILFGSNFSALAPGHKRKCSNRTDSEDSGVCSPSPTPSAGSLPGTSLTFEGRHLEIRNGHPVTVTNKASENSKSTNSSYVSPMEVDDGISDDHSINGDSCGSFSDHKSRWNSSSSCSSYLIESGPNVSDKRLEQNNKISFAVDHNGPKVVPDVKVGGAQLARNHLSSFDSGKFSILTSKMAKGGSLKVSASQVESKSVGRNSNGLRYQCQLKIADVNNLVSLNGDVVTALEVS